MLVILIHIYIYIFDQPSWTIHTHKHTYIHTYIHIYIGKCDKKRSETERYRCSNACDFDLCIECFKSSNPILPPINNDNKNYNNNISNNNDDNNNSYYDILLDLYESPIEGVNTQEKKIAISNLKKEEKEN